MTDEQIDAMETQSSFGRAPPSGTTTAISDEDPIHELGDRIAALTPHQAKKLREYVAILKLAREGT